MPFSIELDQDNQYVKLMLSGEMTKQDHHNARAEAVRLLIENEWTRLLIDARQIDARMSLTDDFEFTEAHRTNIPSNIQTAVIHREDESERFEFIENVAFNRGQKLKVFTNPDQAIQWLTGH